MEDSMVEICVSIGARSCAQQLLPLFAAQESDVLHHVCNALFFWALIHTACTAQLTCVSSLPTGQCPMAGTTSCFVCCEVIMTPAIADNKSCSLPLLSATQGV